MPALRLVFRLLPGPALALDPSLVVLADTRRPLWDRGRRRHPAPVSVLFRLRAGPPRETDTVVSFQPLIFSDRRCRPPWGLEWGQVQAREAERCFSELAGQLVMLAAENGHCVSPSAHQLQQLLFLFSYRHQFPVACRHSGREVGVGCRQKRHPRQRASGKIGWSVIVEGRMEVAGAPGCPPGRNGVVAAVGVEERASPMLS